MVEADFLREYGIDLRKVLTPKGMTWRRFMTLLRGLSPQSATVEQLKQRRYIGQKAGAKETVMASPQAAQSAFVALFGGKRKA